MSRHKSRAALGNLPRASGFPVCSAIFKAEPGDFCVEEDLGFALSGVGEHLCLQVRKTGVATPQVQRILARVAGLREADIGYAGLKDRQGICTQWFSLCMPVPRDTDFSALAGHNIEVLQVIRNSRKIRRGSHRANLFRIRLRELRAPELLDKRLQDGATCQEIEDRLRWIDGEGVPNYFGEQRFGIENHNIVQAADYLAGRLKLPKGFKRGMLLSAARSSVFNEILGQRVTLGTWNRYLDGDVMNLEGSDSIFVPEEWDEQLESRLASGDIHPTGAMWGAGELRSAAATRMLELEIRNQWHDLCDGLEKAGLQQARRSLRLNVKNLRWQWLTKEDLELAFELPPGAYATAVLRELCTFSSGSERA